jgi:dUTP pyrophosphatase
MKVKIKRLNPLAVAPSRANKHDAGFDLVATSIEYPSGSTGVFIEVCTGLSFEIPPSYVGLIFPRSSISDTKHFLRNSVGVIDSGYRGEVKLRFSVDDSITSYQIGDRVGQIVFVKLPVIELIESESLAESDREEGGFGSSGR